MNDWDFSPPPLSELGDRQVPREGDHLLGKRVALMLTGGIATIKAPFIARALRRQGADVVAFVTEEALRYTTTDALEWSTTNPVVARLTARAEHLSDDAPFDVYLVAPATYNTINKVRHGIADTTVTSTLASALGRLERGTAQVLVAPTMHGSMHNALLTESLETLRDLGVRVIPPREAYGKHNIPETPALVAEVCRAASTSPLKGAAIVVTGGPTPVPIDNVRRITNRFRGRLGVEIAGELWLRGAEVVHIQGDGAIRPQPFVPCEVARTYDEYRAKVGEALARTGAFAGVFSAAVADYRPESVAEGKIPSGGALRTLSLVPTVKVIDEVRDRFPDLAMVSFKYQEDVSHEELMAIVRERLSRGHSAVVANRGEETGPEGEQVAHLVTREAEPLRLEGKPAIARAVADHLERVAGRKS